VLRLWKPGKDASAARNANDILASGSPIRPAIAGLLPMQFEKPLAMNDQRMRRAGLRGMVRQGQGRRDDLPRVDGHRLPVAGGPRPGALQAAQEGFEQGVVNSRAQHWRVRRDPALAHHRDLRNPHRDEFNRALKKVLAVNQNTETVRRAKGYLEGV
jgi:hypothetical protein